ncbi:MAG: porin [Bacteroidaceae bacterium]|nr:porin [Bacteroidaceae bacterium]
MKKYLSFAIMASLVSFSAYAENEVNNEVTETETENVIGTDAVEPSGFLTSALNSSIEKALDEDVQYGRKVTQYASAPKFGGYYIGKYGYSDKDGSHGGEGFSQRLIRLYVDGSIYGDFKYRIQLQVNNASVHTKDVFVEWAHWKEFKVKVGQFKRCFTFENPYNPWDVGVGDYSQLTKKMSGMGDYNGEANMGGRDQGLQIQGDLLPISDDKHSFIHYQLAVYNGQGINVSDNADPKGKKDLIGTIQFQPIKDLYIGVFGWDGQYTQNGVTVDRHRYAFGAKYEHDGWSARAEYAHSQGHKISDFNSATGTFSGAGKADAWYATVGVPVNDWFKCYVKYDAYRENAKWNSLKSIYTIAPNFQIHKNLMLQLQYNYVNDKTSGDKHYNELWAETYFRF